MIRICLCDDEKQFLSRLSNIVKLFFKKQDEPVEICCCETSSELIRMLEKGFHLYLLDIAMPDLDGIELAAVIRKAHPEAVLIFVSNDASSVFGTFRVNPLRFVRKELLETDLAEALTAFYDHYCRFSQNILLDIPDRHAPIQSLLVKDIVYLESHGHYLNIHCISGELRVRGKIDDYLTRLPAYHFGRSGKSFLINLQYVEFYLGHEVILKTGGRIPVSRNFANGFREDYLRFVRQYRHHMKD